MSYESEQNLSILESEAARLGATDAQISCMKNIMMAESGGKTRAAAKTSSAKGLFQIIDDSWNTYTRNLALNNTDRFDPRANCQVMYAIVKDNTTDLKRVIGRDPTAGELYLAHFTGSTGASKVLRASGDTPVSSVLSAKAISANSGMKFRGKKFAEWTCDELEDWAATKMGMDLAARTRYQERHDNNQTTPDEDQAEEKIRKGIMKLLGMGEDAGGIMPQGGLLGQIFFALIKALLGADPVPVDRTQEKETNDVTTAPNTAPQTPAQPPQDKKPDAVAKR